MTEKIYHLECPPAIKTHEYKHYFRSRAILKTMLTCIKNTKAVTKGQIVQTDLFFQDGIIIEKPSISPDRTIDAEGLLAVPGFIDTHIHGFGGQGTEDGSEEAILTMSEYLGRVGVTTFFPTIYTDTMDRILMDEEAIVNAIGKEEGAVIGGIHVEGPFISPNKIGAQNPLGRKDPSVEIFRKIIDKGNGYVKAMTCAPELSGIEKVAEEAEKASVVLLMGHTDATYEEAVRGIDLGIRHTTHLFNAMTGLVHRHPGAVGAALINDKATVEIIGDGKHVHKDIVLFVIKVKGPDKVAIITDSLRPTNQTSGALTANGVEVEMGDGLWVTKGNRDLIQGSALNMHKAFKNLVSWGLPVEKAVEVTSTTPAAIYNMKDRGSLECGKRADIVLLDNNLEISKVIIGGKEYVV